MSDGTIKKRKNRYLKSLRLGDGRNIRVVRHDLVEGGTKRLVLPSVLRACHSRHIGFRDRTHRYVYASPSFGYAQLAIAVACRDLGYESSIFVPARKELTKITVEAKNAGAKIVEVNPGYLVVCQKRARDYAAEVNGVELPFGLMCQEMVDGICKVAHGLRIKPKEVWLASASGTLWRGLCQAWPYCFFNIVAPGKKQKIEWTSRFPRMRFKIWYPKEKFHQEAREKPPYPSAVNYDAKIWQFALRHARDGAVIWNVAG